MPITITTSYVIEELLLAHCRGLGATVDGAACSPPQARENRKRLSVSSTFGVRTTGDRRWVAIGCEVEGPRELLLVDAGDWVHQGPIYEPGNAGSRTAQVTLHVTLPRCSGESRIQWGVESSLIERGFVL